MIYIVVLLLGAIYAPLVAWQITGSIHVVAITLLLSMLLGFLGGVLLWDLVDD